MKKPKLIIVAVTFAVAISPAVAFAFKPEQLLNRMNLFLIRQMEFFDPIRPYDQPPLIQTYGWDTNLPLPPIELNPPPCGNLPCAPSPIWQIAYRGDIYDQSLAAIFFAEKARLDFIRGSDGRENFSRAKKLLDAIIFLEEFDPYHDGRIRTAYWANDLLNPERTASSIMDPSTGIGNICYFGIALTRFYYVSKVTNYLDPNERQQYIEIAREKADWIISHCKDDKGPGGFTGGYDDWTQIPFTWKSTEHNIDAYVFARNLYAIDRDTKWLEMAGYAQIFVQSMYVKVDRQHGYYQTGTLEDGITPNPTPIPVDAQVWTALARNNETRIDTSERAKCAIRWLLDPDNGLLQDCCDCQTDCRCHGVKFSMEGTNIQIEISASTAMALYLMNQKKDATCFFNCLDWVSLNAQPDYDGIEDTIGIVATPSLEGAWTGYGEYAWYYKLLHTASSAWTGMAVLVAQGDKMANPLMPLPKNLNCPR
jgi:hypothetical protein